MRWMFNRTHAQYLTISPAYSLPVIHGRLVETMHAEKLTEDDRLQSAINLDKK